jgi:hypothetical protein
MDVFARASREGFMAFLKKPIDMEARIQPSPF